ncbi:MAG: hypothetical protein WA989_15885 [Henriciella sp.]|uniref:DUF1579 domain-containing protein n=1 Tax=Henriciella sp. TaxID=1968823 RepID=UPI003C748BB0
MPHRLVTASTIALLLAASAAAEGEKPPHPLEPFFGTWVGEAHGRSMSGDTYDIVQTERVGPMLSGDIAVIEGRGYSDDGTLAFNAFAVVHCKTPEACKMQSYVDGRSGNFDLVPTETGFEWTIPLPNEAKVVYTATLEGDVWTEVGHYHPLEGEPVETVRLRVTRTGDTDWPGEGALVPPEE